jgi:hypothetical protein
MSIRTLLQTLREHPSEAAFVSDEALADILKSGVSLLQAVRAAVESELLCRLWLYGRQVEGTIFDALCLYAGAEVSGAVKHLAPDFRRGDFSTVLTLGAFLGGGASETLQKFHKRRVAFENAHGMVPVVNAAGEAFPVPFRLEPERSLQSALVVLDGANRRIPAWESQAEGLTASLGSKGWRVSVSCIQPEGKEVLVGGSFALPVWLAFSLMHRGVSALDWLASGAIGEGRLKAVDSLAAKRELARKLGVRLWVSVGEGPSVSGRPCFLPGMPLGEARGSFEESLEAHGIVPLSEASILAQSVSLSAQVERKAVDYDHARTRALRWRDWLAGEGKKGRPAYLKTLVLLAAIDNHSGHASRADDWFREIQRGCWKHGALDRFRAINQFVVSLADRMLLEESERVARDLVDEVELATFGEEEDYLLAKIGAVGALGGEPLLWGGLKDPAKAHEAKVCLERSAQAALQLIQTCGTLDWHRYHYSKSAVRTALWTALFQPDRMAEVHGRVRGELEAMAAADPVSLTFLSRHRWLAAYRLWKLTGTVVGGFGALEMAEPRNDSDLWLKATSLKYRGTLLAASEDFDAAARDFNQAAGLLSASDGPVIQIIFFSILVQANELFEDAGRAPLFTRERLDAILSGISCAVFPSAFLEAWRLRGRGDRSVDPQKDFPY